MRVGYEGMHMVAVNEYEEVYGNMRELADYFFVAPPKINQVWRKGTKIRGYRIYEHWRNKYSIVERKTGEVLYTGITKEEICKQMGCTRAILDRIQRYGDRKYALLKEKEVLWRK